MLHLRMHPTRIVEGKLWKSCELQSDNFLSSFCFLMMVRMVVISSHVPPFTMFSQAVVFSGMTKKHD